MSQQAPHPTPTQHCRKWVNLFHMGVLSSEKKCPQGKA